MPAKIVAMFTPKPGKAAEVEAVLRTMLSPTRAEPGNLRYDLWREEGENGRFVFDELYVDMDAVAAHRAQPYFTAYRAAIADLLAEPLTVAVVQECNVCK
jgi:quinol monooxygenase YgiN